MKVNRMLILLAVIGLFGFVYSGSSLAADLEYVTFNINVALPSGQDIDLHRITADWTETGVTWNNFGGSYDGTVIATFNADIAGWHSVDITALYLAWISGTPNYGLLLAQDDNTYPRTRYRSRETSHDPYLEVCYSTPTGYEIFQVPAFADSYIWEVNPDTNYGSATRLYTGWASPSDLEKQTLVRFEIEEANLYTPGYWKTHSSYGPAPYDETWAMLPLGADTIFFLSGQTYYEVLWTPPKNGNAYYILSRAYIAAELNQLTGAPIPPDVLDAFNDAAALFSMYTPADIGALKGNKPLRKEFIKLAEILDDYNNGLYSP